MSNSSNEQSVESLFGEVISTYTRAQAIEDGVLIDVSQTGVQAGFCWPVALSSAAWENCVAWTEEDTDKQICQDVPGRRWDVLYLAAHAIKTSKNRSDQLLYRFYRIPRDGWSKAAQLVTLKLIVGPGDQGEPVVTIMLPDED